MPAVKIENLSFIYSKKTPNEKAALKNINLEIEEGSFVGLVGATGSGKSTLIQHLNGLIRVQDKKKSKVVVAGLSAAEKKNLKALRFKVGMVFQYPEYQLFEDTVEKDVAFGPKNMKLSEAEINSRVKRAIELVGLDYESIKERSPFDLSGGEKRRVAIAGVIAMQPEILVLDEPVAGLDPVGREEILALIKKLQKEVSPTVITVSHSMDDMSRFADRIIVLKDGEIALDGTPREVFESAEEIRNAGLELPTAAAAANALRVNGLDLKRGIITMDELADELVRLKRARAEKGKTENGKTETSEGTDKDVESPVSKADSVAKNRKENLRKSADIFDNPETVIKQDESDKENTTSESSDNKEPFGEGGGDV